MRLTDGELSELASLDALDRRGCLSEGLIVRAVGGELGPLERESVADHLGACAECVAEHRLLLSLTDWAERSAGRSGGAVRAAPGVLATRALRAAAVLVALGVLSWNVWLQRSNRALSERARLDAPAGQAETSGARVAELERELWKASQPELNPVIAELEPLDALRGGVAAGQARTLVVPAAARFVSLILVAGSGSDRLDHEVEVSDGAGGVVWSSRGLRRSSDGSFTLALPARLLPEGEYRVRVTGPSGPGPDGTEQFTFRVRRP